MLHATTCGHDHNINFGCENNNNHNHLDIKLHTKSSTMHAVPTCLKTSWGLRRSLQTSTDTMIRNTISTATMIATTMNKIQSFSGYMYGERSVRVMQVYYNIMCVHVCGFLASHGVLAIVLVIHAYSTYKQEGFRIHVGHSIPTLHVILCQQSHDIVHVNTMHIMMCHSSSSWTVSRVTTITYYTHSG